MRFVTTGLAPGRPMRRRNGFPALVGPGEQDGENGARARRAAAAYARAPGFLSVFLS
jgi:hypothetical protein